jgi:signal transduction histidine kinase
VPLSRLRLRLSAAFALAFALGLAVLNTAIYLALRRDADRQLTHRLQTSATDVAEALAREYGERPRAGLAAAARETFREWPATGNSFVVYDGAGARLATHGDAVRLAVAPATWHAGDPDVLDRVAGRDDDVRVVADRQARARGATQGFRVLAVGPREPTEERLETLGWWMLASAPLVVLLSLVCGYVLARHALGPIRTLERDVAALDPADLARRLPVAERPDELDRLALRFNELLRRLEQAQRRNRQFVQRAAHQLKTPLTVVLGEADLSLNGAAEGEAHAPGMRRVRTAARQMRRRVDELLLLAEAQAGESVPLDDLVELDGLALECADLMRGRAAQLERSLTLGRVESLTVRGSERLLREALVELIENACRHGSPEPPICVSVHAEGPVAWVDVVSGGPPTPAALADLAPGDDGMHLGLTIVRWIAAQHGGRFRYEHVEGRNVFGFSTRMVRGGVSRVTAVAARDR